MRFTVLRVSIRRALSLVSGDNDSSSYRLFFCAPSTDSCHANGNLGPRAKPDCFRFPSSLTMYSFHNCNCCIIKSSRSEILFVFVLVVFDAGFLSIRDAMARYICHSFIVCGGWLVMNFDNLSFSLRILFSNSFTLSCNMSNIISSASVSFRELAISFNRSSAH